MFRRFCHFSHKEKKGNENIMHILTYTYTFIYTHQNNLIYRRQPIEHKDKKGSKVEKRHSSFNWNECFIILSPYVIECHKYCLWQLICGFLQARLERFLEFFLSYSNTKGFCHCLSVLELNRCLNADGQNFYDRIWRLWFPYWSSPCKICTLVCL